MPCKDGTGPMGQGSMSGRGFGFCRNDNEVGYTYGRGYGRGVRYFNGCKRGFGGNFNGQMFGMSYEETLSKEKDFLKRRLEAIDKQLQNFKVNEK